MTGGGSPLQYAPHSRVLSCVPLHSVTQCTSSRVALQQAFDPLPACFAVGLLSSLASSQIPALGTTLAETPLLEVCPAKNRSSLPCFPSTLLLGLGAPSQRSLHSNLDVERIVTAIWGPRRGSHLEYSASVPSLRLGHSPDVRRLCLDRQSLLGDTTASDDEFSMPTKTPGWNRGSHFPPLAGLAGMHRILCPNSRIGVLSLRLCSLCSGVFPSLPRSHLFIRCAANSTSTISLRRAGLWPLCDASVEPSVSWPDRQRAR